MRKRLTVILMLVWMVIFVYMLESLVVAEISFGSFSKPTIAKAEAPQRRRRTRRYRRRRIRVSRGGRGYYWLPGEDLPSGHVEGIASYYRWKGGMHAACLVAPKGAKVKVTNLETGKAIEVLINDHGPFVPGRVIDLDRDAFVALFGGTSRGLGPVALDW